MPPAKGSAEVIVGGSTERGRRVCRRGRRRVCRRSLLKGLLEDSLQGLAEELLKGLTEPTSVSWHFLIIKSPQNILNVKKQASPCLETHFGWWYKADRTTLYSLLTGYFVPDLYHGKVEFYLRLCIRCR